MLHDPEACYRAVASRDARFDGRFVVAVNSTRIYCRPSCPARTPRADGVRYYATVAGAQSDGYRACLRCRPDAAPGSPDWDARADVAGRAMRLIADGVVDREGVPGLARRLGYTERHVHRVLGAELGAGPLALARARRAETARILIETTTLPFAEVAFAAGFGSVRQFNDTVRATYGRVPSELRRRRPAAATEPGGAIALRLPYRAPLDVAGTLAFLGARAVPGVEEVVDGAYRRVLDLPHGPGIVELRAGDGHVACSLRLVDLRDLAAAVERCRRLLDLDADPAAVDAVLAGDAALAPLVRSRPGTRVPGAVSGDELVVRAILGQQVSVAGARTLAARLAVALGVPRAAPDGGLSVAFPRADALAEAPDAVLAMPAARRDALRRTCAALAAGDVVIDAGADRVEARRSLGGLRGIGPWTVEYVAMRGLGDPDAFPATDLGVLHGARALGLPEREAGLAAHAERWRPWRAYAVPHLWQASVTPRPAG